MANEISLQTLAEAALSAAKQRGATQAEMSISEDRGFNAIVRNAEIDTIEYERDRDIDITVYFGHRKGHASTTDARIEGVAAAVEAACHIAKMTGEDPCSGLASADLMATEFPDLDLYHPWSINPEQAVEIALDCEAYSRELDSRVTNSDSVSVGTLTTRYVYANSHGFLGQMHVTRHDIAASLIAEVDDEMERGFYYTIARDSKDLVSIKEVARKAVEYTVTHLGGRQIKTKKMPVLFVPEVACGLIGHFVSAIRGSTLYRKSSFLVDKLGESIFPSFITMQENPFLPKALASTAFDSDGLATQCNRFVTDGILTSYSLGTYSARRLGMVSTANADGIHNLIVSHGSDDLDAMIRKLDTGLIVTEMMGQGVSLMTGDYSRGVRGFYVKNGKIQFPVSEITIAGNLRNMFRGIVAVGNDVDRRGAIHVGSILVDEMMVAGE